MPNQLEYNLDLLCFEHGTKIPILGNEKNENTIQKPLGVLEENGIFAFILFLGAKGAFKNNNLKKEEKIARNIKEKICDLLKKQEINLLKDNINTNDQKEVIDAFRSIGENLNKLFLAKMLIEKTLIYALYHAKASD